MSANVDLQGLVLRLDATPPTEADLLRAQQLGLFEWAPKPAVVPPPVAPPPVAPHRVITKPPGAGWEMIPRGRHGGFRRRHGIGYEYWYPGMTGTTPAARHGEEEAHGREAAEDAEAGLRHPGDVGAAPGGPGRDPGDDEGASTEEGRAVPRGIVQLAAIEGPPRAAGIVPDGRPWKAPDNPAIPFYAELLPAIPDEVRLPPDVVEFPVPMPITDPQGNVVGHIERLYPHQQEAAERILLAWQRGDGVLLQDEAGLGKTNAALAALVAHGGKRNLIVVPVGGKANLKGQWASAEAAGLYGIKLRGVDDLSATEDGYYIVGYDELFETVRGEDGKVVKRKTKALFDGQWDTITFDECHNMKGTKERALAGKDLMDKAAKVIYMSATPAENIKDLHYLTRLGLFDDFAWNAKEGRKATQEEQFVAWAESIGAFVKGDPEKPRRYSDVHNPSSLKPMAAVAATLHVDGKSVKRKSTMEGVTSTFQELSSSDLAPEHAGAFKTAGEIIKAGEEAGINGMLTAALHVGWARQYWEALKTPQAIELGKAALAAGKQVAFFTGYKTMEHAHMWAVPRMLNKAADKLAESGAPEAVLAAQALRDKAAAIGAIAQTLPVVEPPVAVLAREFGGPKAVAEIHGATNKPTPAEMKAYQSGQKRIVVATMSKGGTGISLHDTSGKAPRVQINLTTPWTGKEFVQVSGRSHRLGSKSETEFHWILGDDENERHMAGVLAKRLKQLGSLTIGDPDLVTDAATLQRWEAGNVSAMTENDDAAADVEQLVAAAEAAEAGDDTPENSQDVRDYFLEYAQARGAGRDVLKERYTEVQEERAAAAFNEGRRAAEQLRRKMGWTIHWRPAQQVFEIIGSSGHDYGKSPEQHWKTITGKKIQGAGKSHLDSYWVSAATMPKLAKELEADTVPVKLREVTRIEKLTPGETDHLYGQYAEMKIRMDPTDTVSESGQRMYALHGGPYIIDRALSGLGAYDHDRRAWMLPEGNLGAGLENYAKVRAADEEDRQRRQREQEKRDREEAATWAGREGARREAEERSAGGPPRKGDVATYKGKRYRIGYIGPTKYGRRAKLEYLDGSKDFWVDANAVSKGLEWADLSKGDAAPPGAGWEIVPHGRHSGFRRRKGTGYDYWYPGDTAVSRRQPAEHEPSAAHAEHDKAVQETVAGQMLAESKGTAQEDFHFRAYLRAVRDDNKDQATHLARTFPGALRARHAFIDQWFAAKACKAPNLAGWHGCDDVGLVLALGA